MSSKNIILLDIFSYSCMNCMRSLTYIKKINNKHKKYGLQTILVHPPEWNFEKKKKNIVNAVKKYGIGLPIVIDKDKKMVNKLKIDFWPAQVLIKDGKILYRHVGEGNYKKLEEKIAKFSNIESEFLFDKEPKYSRFPTVYCGKRKEGKIARLKNKKLKFGIVYIDDNWEQENEFLKSIKDNSLLTILTKSKIANFVAESLNGKDNIVNILLNNKFIKKIKVNKPQLYRIIRLKANKQHRITIISNKSLAVYSFSFQ